LAKTSHIQKESITCFCHTQNLDLKWWHESKRGCLGRRRQEKCRGRLGKAVVGGYDQSVPLHLYNTMSQWNPLFCITNMYY
jgi:hypothetical protein